ncbi:putative RNA polymerase sigma factor FecI [Gemmata obscuriglobus]|uniref:Sigma-70 family RNA polymerase sigma factor n=1 Tax=Gemmata obscuriglobus TaxID=114 RepID=A0A2Z3H663_9BACT|nr:sigma-70 family RNA polymerase sigma factor [Gemmata obscuriglobus]AWM41503.1 sigma-70 family RNA polymerase sigma factor [Gemmata obscuriglobus]QEG32589.1 putative RNA polymerase sigma factor FecI [Gemmata obscuriglobus]VTS11945.1 rna polymerase sigma-e factor-like protein : RNA polymerase sigma factor, sigma-70 family OS=Singulisphaera acidiphila (strain ATCC BAA-1392 / DSM 18658 / VKM B-2454 / MOB10) GN=Sinac_1390 PE=4 SV=1: Sigma70_r4_2 [Gemmata obscuriglobus UQM 2246]
MEDDTPFTAVDRDLLKRCLNRDPGSWNDFVDRFLSLIYHTIGYTAHLRSARVGPEDVEDIAAEVLLQIVANNFKVLREFRKQSSLATYLTVITRRTCIHELVRRQKVKDAIRRGESRLPEPEPDDAPVAQKGMESLEEVEKLLNRLSGPEREIVRLYYLEGRTYEEISTETDVPVNTIGAVLSRARKKLRASVAASGTELPVLANSLRPAAAPKPPLSAVIKPSKPSKTKREPLPGDKTEVPE